MASIAEIFMNDCDLPNSASTAVAISNRGHLGPRIAAVGPHSAETGESCRNNVWALKYWQGRSILPRLQAAALIFQKSQPFA